MKKILSVLTVFYSWLLRFYPGSFREEFSEEMLLDFRDTLDSASQNGIFSLSMVLLRELRDIPINLLQSHWKESSMLKILRSQPVSNGLRGAIGFGIGFASVAIAGWGVSNWLYTAFEPAIANLSIWYYDIFHDEIYILLSYDILSLISFALTGVIFGLLFALFLGDRSNRFRYIFAGTLGWFIPHAISHVLSRSFGWSFYLSESQSNILGITGIILTGVLLSATFSMSESYHKKTFKLLAAGVIVYPLGVYLFIKFLLFMWIEITPWFFIALIILMVIIIGSVFALVIMNDRKIPWMVIVGAVGYPVLFYAASFIAYTIFHLPVIQLGVGISQEDINIINLHDTAINALFGVLFGLLMGVVLGLKKKNSPPQIIA